MKIAAPLLKFEEQLFETVRQNDTASLKNLLDSKWAFLFKARNMNKWNGSGDTLLTLAAKSGNRELVTILLENNASINSPDSSGNTPLHHAIIAKNKEMIRFLISKRANIMIPTRDSRTPLWLAITSNQPEIVTLLKAKGAITLALFMMFI